MRSRGGILGGEESGHIIFLRHTTTGDGILSGLQLLAAMQQYHRPLSDLAAWMPIFPQVLLNVAVREKPDLAAVPELRDLIRKIEAELGDRSI